MTETKYAQKIRERDAHRDELRAILRPGARVWITTEYGKGSASYIRVFIIRNGDIVNVTWRVAGALDRRLRDRAGRNWLPVPGVGVNPARHIANHLSAVLHGADDALEMIEL